MEMVRIRCWIRWAETIFFECRYWRAGGLVLDTVGERWMMGWAALMMSARYPERGAMEHTTSGSEFNRCLPLYVFLNTYLSENALALGYFECPRRQHLRNQGLPSSDCRIKIVSRTKLRDLRSTQFDIAICSTFQHSYPTTTLVGVSTGSCPRQVKYNSTD